MDHSQCNRTPEIHGWGLSSSKSLHSESETIGFNRYSVKEFIPALTMYGQKMIVAIDSDKSPVYYCPENTRRLDTHERWLESEENRKHLLLGAYYAASTSPDESTQNGSIVVGNSLCDESKTVQTLSQSNNRFIDNFERTEENTQRPRKYDLTVHAEAGSVYAAARSGVCLDGAIMACPWFACVDCAKAIAGSGIKVVLGHMNMMLEAEDRYKKVEGAYENWSEQIQTSFEILSTAGVACIFHRGPIVHAPIIRLCGEPFDPSE